MSVDAGTHRGAAESQFGERNRGGLEPSPAQFHLAGIPGKFLAEPDGNRILQMGAAHL